MVESHRRDARTTAKKEHSDAPPATDAAVRSAITAAMPALTRFARRLVEGPNAADADDVVQDALTRAWHYRASWDRDTPITPWLLRIAFRVAIDARDRRARRRSVETDTFPVDTASADPTIDALEIRDELAERLRCLSPLERDLLVGFHRDGLSMEDLAGRHAIPVGTVKSHLHRARRKLRRAP